MAKGLRLARKVGYSTQRCCHRAKWSEGRSADVSQRVPVTVYDVGSGSVSAIAIAGVEEVRWRRAARMEEGVVLLVVGGRRDVEGG